jgi:hypothetical protein
MKKKQFTSLKINSTLDQLEYIKSIKDKKYTSEIIQTNYGTNATRSHIKGLVLSPHKKENPLLNVNMPITVTNATHKNIFLKRDSSINDRKIGHTAYTCNSNVSNNNYLNNFVTEGNRINSYYHKSNNLN